MKQVSYHKFQMIRRFLTRYLPAIGLGHITDFYGDNVDSGVFYVRTDKKKKFELTISDFKYGKLYLWISDTEFITFSLSKRIRPISHTIKKEREYCKQTINFVNGNIVFIYFVEIVSPNTSVMETTVEKQCESLKIESSILCLPRVRFVSVSEKY